MSCSDNAGVTSFNGRRGAVSLTPQDIRNAIGGTPLFAPVANASLATMADGTVKANLSGGVAAPQDVTLAALAAALGDAFTISDLTSGASGGNTVWEIQIGQLYLKCGTVSATSAASGSSGEAALTFPHPFPNQIIMAGATLKQPSGAIVDVSYNAYYRNESVNGINIGVDQTSPPTATFTVSWWALGR